MKFIDLFAGLGGFHIALSRLGHDCVFASEINEPLRSLYERNFQLLPKGDIKEIKASDIPRHDILCAGFPCQPFSKAGDQQGFSCPKWGNLFDHVMRIVRHHEPAFVILENVPNLERHDQGNTWTKIKSDLVSAGYDIQEKRLSPHQFGIPQIRERIFIVGRKGRLEGFAWPAEKKGLPLSINAVLDAQPLEARPIPKNIEKAIKVWQRFVKLFPKDEELPSFPIWSMEFGATYPYETSTPHSIGIYRLAQFKGSHGVRLSKLPAKLRANGLPAYAQTTEKRFPKWKVDFIRQNREFYKRHKKWIKPWLPQLLPFPSSYQKFEWNCKGEKRNVWDYVIQMRASGIRVKRPTTAPALVAMTTSQVPIIGWERRYMTARECARLQSFHELKHLPDGPTKAFKALGNAINADLVELIAQSLILPKPRPRRTSSTLLIRQATLTPALA